MAIDMKGNSKIIISMVKVHLGQLTQRDYLGKCLLLLLINQVNFSMRAKRFTKDSGRMAKNMVKGR